MAGIYNIDGQEGRPLIEQGATFSIQPTFYQAGGVVEGVARDTANKRTAAGVLLSVDATAKTIRRSAGSWSREGFVADGWVTLAGFDSGGNNGHFQVESVTTLLLTLKPATSGLVTEVNVSGATCRRPLDLTGVVPRAMLRKNYTDASPAATFACALSDTPTDGTVTCVLADEVTAALVCGTKITDAASRYVWDLELPFPDGTVMRGLQGQALVSAEATK